MNALVDLFTKSIRDKLQLRKSINKWFLRNAAAKHDVPWTENDDIEIPSEVAVNINMPNGVTESMDKLSEALVKKAEEKVTVEVAPVKVEPIKQTVEVQTPTTPATPPSTPSEGAVSSNTFSSNPLVEKVMKALAAAAATGALLGGGYWLGNRGDNDGQPAVEPPAASEPTTEQTTTTLNQDLLLSYLQEKGRHLPENKWDVDN